MRSFSRYKRSARSRNLVICQACSSCFASISWRQWRNWSSMGGFTGLLDMAINSDGSVGCSRMARLRRSEDHLGVGVPKHLRIVSKISCSVFPTYSANCNRRNSQSQWIVEAFTSWLQPAKQTRRRRWYSVAPPMEKLASFFLRLRA